MKIIYPKPIMDSFLTFLIGFGYIIFIAWMIGSSNIEITPEQINAITSVKVCDTNDGVKIYDVRKTKLRKVICNNGANFIIE